MRKTKTVVIPGERKDEPGFRDCGKTFLLTEMASRPAEKWADRAFLALAHSKLDIPDRSRARGMAWIDQLQILAGHIHFPELEPLMDELMGCIRRVESETGYERALIDVGAEGDDIEEVATRHFLRSEVIGLHVNFLLHAAVLNWIADGSTMTEAPLNANPPKRRTSRQPSQPSSAPN